MIVGRPISEICRELAASAETDHQPILAQILRMASLEAARLAHAIRTTPAFAISWSAPGTGTSPTTAFMPTAGSPACSASMRTWRRGARR